MTVTAVYPGTFDPITNGHSDLIVRASKLFDKVIVGIANNSTKQPLFNLNERVNMAKQVLADINNVEVVGFSGLLVDFAKEYRATVLLRGLRTTVDFEYELQLAAANKRLYNELESIFLPPAEHCSFISSTLVKEIALHHGDVSEFVKPQVKANLMAKFAEASSS